MGERSNLRLVILSVLVISLMATLLGRLFYLQVMTGESYRVAAQSNTVREVVTPAVRGLILDQAGRPLVANRTSLVVTVDRVTLQREADDGAEVIARLAQILYVPQASISDRLMTCGADGAKPPPVCWNGSPFQPIPIARDVDAQTALSIMESRVDFPGVTAGLEAIRTYPAPFDVNAAHLLGYLGPVTEDALTQQGDSTAYDRLRRTDVVGRSGLEATYDDAIRGKPAVTTLEVDTSGRITKTLDEKLAVAGDYIVSTIDARLQHVVEQQLVAAVQRAQAQGYPGDSGAAVVVDVRNGHILAMASYPTYDPSIWVGGVTEKQYQDLKDSDALSSNAIQGLFAPGSTFKVISTAAASREGFSLYSKYQCPNQVKLGTQTFRNFESSGYGPITLKRAIEVSCNTVFYGIADKMWTDAGGNDANRNSPDPIAETAKMFGLNAKTGIDLPDEATGRVSSRTFKVANWEQKRGTWCANAISGYPETRKTNPQKADYFTALDRENCADGFRWREGDALNAAIGQGDTAVTPLQMAMAYSAIANGGTLYQPQMVKAIIGADGRVVEEIAPVVTDRVDVSRTAINFINSALQGVTMDGSGAAPFAGFPLNQIPVASKTGSAQVTGSKVSTSWFASFAPANKPRYAVVMMVTQGGTGSKTSGPSVRKIYEEIFGVTGSTVNPAKSVLVDGAPLKRLPTVRPDGTPVVPRGKMSGQGSGGSS
ncbi:MAG: penicillin-binding protein 2 [Candidatus Nanopelagicales bacterium]|nr:penicillin-binding protein 2 [Candidatus Nanopelagicales bacterium]